MRIGVIGAGNLGATAARLFVRAGHEVALARSRGPEGLGVLVAELGPRAHATTVEHAARFGEVVLVAVPFERYRELPAQALAGKIVIDAMNHYPSSGDGFPEIAEGATTSSGLLAAHLRDARVVKAFNTMYWKLLAVRGRPPGAGEERLALFLAGDHDEAKELVAGLIEEAGFTPVDSGDLAEGARRQQPGAPIYTELARRRKEGGEPPGLTEQEARAALGRPTAWA